jgi:hypothetical protein
VTKKEYGKKYYQEHREQARKWRKKYYEANKDEAKERGKRWCDSHREHRQKYSKTYKLKTLYGITQEDRNKIIEFQKGICPVCHDILDGIKSCVDHNHVTNKVRGILCNNCNLLLGSSRDNISILESAIEYLKYHKGASNLI